MPASRHQRWPIESSALVSALDSRSRGATRLASSVTATVERAEPAHRVGRQSERALRRDHRRERPGIGDAAENRQQQPAIRHRLRPRRQRPRATISFSISMRTRSAERLARPARAPMQARVSGAIGLARAVGGVNAEEAQDAQIILGDALAGVADEAHAPGGDIGQPADMVVHDAVGVDRQRR